MIRRRLREADGRFVVGVIGGAVVMTAGLAYLSKRTAAAAQVPTPAPTPPAPAPIAPIAPATVPVSTQPQTGFGTTLCSEADLPPYLQGLVTTLKTNPSVTPELLDSWGTYFDKMCPIVGAELHDLALTMNINQLHASLPVS